MPNFLFSNLTWKCPILLDTRTCIILFYFQYSHITTDDNVPVLQFIVDIFEILKYSNNR